MTRFSVITATYNLIENNRSKTFLQAAASVAAARHPSVEHLVIDGASTDGTADLVRQAGVDAFHSEPDTGIFQAMNRGAQLASGEYLIFLNSDDFHHDPEGLDRIDAELHRSGADFVASPILRLDMTGAVTRTTPVSRGFRRCLRTMPFGHPGLVVSRGLFRSLGGFDESFRIASDYDFILRMLFSSARGSAITTPFVSFRDGGASSDTARSDAERMRVWRKNFDPFITLPQAAYDRALRTKSMPIRLCLALRNHQKVPERIRAAARHNLGRSLLRRLIGS